MKYTDKKQVVEWLKLYEIMNYYINDDLSVDVDGSVTLHNKNLSDIPIKFGKILGFFECDRNSLTNLDFAPYYVEHNFNCRENEITSLKNSPEYVGGYFECAHNRIASLEGSPKYIGKSFGIIENLLKDFTGCPKKIMQDLWCGGNPLISIKGISKHIGGVISHGTHASNPFMIEELKDLYVLDDTKQFLLLSISRVEAEHYLSKQILRDILEETLSVDKDKDSRLKI